MPWGGGGGGCRKSVPENINCKNCVNKSIKVYIM